MALASSKRRRTPPRPSASTPYAAAAGEAYQPNVLTSVLKLADVAVAQAVHRHREGTLPSSNHQLGAAERAVGYATTNPAFDVTLETARNALLRLM